MKTDHALTDKVKKQMERGVVFFSSGQQFDICISFRQTVHLVEASLRSVLGCSRSPE